MIAHCFCQEGFGFPYLSPVCYYYITEGEQRALEFCSNQDLSADVVHVVSKLNDCKSREELNDLVATEVCQDVLQRCGITQVLQMENKDLIGQCIITYESVEKISKSLAQLSDGLKSLDFLKALQAFPDLFVSVLTYTANITTQDVVESVYMLEPADDIIMSHLKRYLCELSEDELKNFLLHTTGCVYPQRRSIRVEVHEQAIFTSHTCSRVLSFPKNVFNSSEESYHTFRDGFSAVISDTSFNSV